MVVVVGFFFVLLFKTVTSLVYICVYIYVCPLVLSFSSLTIGLSTSVSQCFVFLFQHLFMQSTDKFRKLAI